MIKYDSVDDYINSFEGKTKTILIEFRRRIKELAPESVESMSYGMPGYKLRGKPLAYFAGFKSHVSFFPTPSGIDSLDRETEPFRTGKGTMQFDPEKTIPWDLVEKIIRFKIGELTS